MYRTSIKAEQQMGNLHISRFFVFLLHKRLGSNCSRYILFLGLRSGYSLNVGILSRSAGMEPVGPSERPFLSGDKHGPFPRAILPSFTMVQLW